MKLWLRDNRGFLVFLVCFGFFRTAVADWNPIPSGSMRPTILEGDVVWVDRLAYDFKLPFTHIAVASLGDPKRGDIVTFNSPRDGTRLIKRIVALPGDTVEMRDSVLYLNGRAARYDDETAVTEPIEGGGSMPAVRAVERVAGARHAVQFLPERLAKRNFGPERLPAGRYFMLGDNRDNSEDSRFIGSVPRALIIGRASRLVVSADIKGHWMPRLERLGKPLE